MLKRLLAVILCFCFAFQQSGFCQIAPQAFIAAAGASVPAGKEKFRPPHLRAVSYDGFAPSLDVLIDKGDGPAPVDPADSRAILKYFLIGLALPDEVFWVNLRPDSPAQMLDDRLARTDLGRVLLEADLQLKKDVAAYTSPMTSEGSHYWDRLYRKAEELFGGQTPEIPTVCRPWIVPGEIVVAETGRSAYIYKATLKVMLEEDYLKGAANGFQDERLRRLNDYAAGLMREEIVPLMTVKVNSAKCYAELRQVYYSLVLAAWFKAGFRYKPGAYPALIGCGKLAGLASETAWEKETYFRAYRDSFEKGEYSLRENSVSASGQSVRTYFSGGISCSLRDILREIDRQRISSAPGVFPASKYNESLKAVYDGSRIDFEKLSPAGSVSAGPADVQADGGRLPSLNVVVQHNEAYYYWWKGYEDKVIPRGSILVNIDYHADLTAGWLEAPVNKRPGAVKEYAGRTDCAQCIAPAIYDGLFDEIYWVVPEWVAKEKGRGYVDFSSGHGRYYLFRAVAVGRENAADKVPVFYFGPSLSPPAECFVNGKSYRVVVPKSPAKIIPIHPVAPQELPDFASEKRARVLTWDADSIPGQGGREFIAQTARILREKNVRPVDITVAKSFDIFPEISHQQIDENVGRVVAEISKDGGGVTLEDYLSDIRRAGREGRIRYSGPAPLEESPYSHLGDTGLRVENTRDLSPIGREMLGMVLRGQESADALELGPGAGKALSDMSGLAEQAGKELNLDLVSQDPLAPHFLLTADWQAIKSAARQSLPESAAAVPLKAVFDLQSGGTKIFERAEKFVRDQFIGPFLDQALVPGRKYHFIYDSMGAFFYSFLGETRQEALDKVFSLLGTDGLFLCEALTSEQTRWLAQKARLPVDICGFISAEERSLVFLKTGGSYYKALSGNLAEARQAADNLYVVDEFQGLLDLLSGRLGGLSSRMMADYQLQDIVYDAHVGKRQARAELAGYANENPFFWAQAKRAGMHEMCAKIFTIPSSRSSADGGQAQETVGGGAGKQAVGGIDFRGLPGTLPPPRFSLLEEKYFTSVAAAMDLDKERSRIERMVDGGMRPSTQRVGEFAAACRIKGETGVQMEALLGFIAGILRIEEERALETEQELRDLLFFLQTGPT